MSHWLNKTGGGENHDLRCFSAGKNEIALSEGGGPWRMHFWRQSIAKNFAAAPVQYDGSDRAPHFRFRFFYQLFIMYSNRGECLSRPNMLKWDKSNCHQKRIKNRSSIVVARRAQHTKVENDDLMIGSFQIWCPHWWREGVHGKVSVREVAWIL